MKGRQRGKSKCELCSKKDIVPEPFGRLLHCSRYNVTGHPDVVLILVDFIKKGMIKSVFKCNEDINIGKIYSAHFSVCPYRIVKFIVLTDLSAFYIRC